MGWITKGSIGCCSVCGYTSTNIVSYAPCPNCSSIRAITSASKRIAKAQSGPGFFGGLVSLIFKTMKVVIYSIIAILVLGYIYGK